MLAGAVLAALALEDRIDTDLESLILLDAAPTGDELLDPVLAEIAADSAIRNAEYWIEKTVLRSDDVLELVLDRLVEKKILTHPSATSGLFPAPSHGPVPIPAPTARLSPT